MKLKKFVPVLVIMLLAVFAATTLVSATPKNYAVTSNYHGIDVPLGTNVVVTATTTDSTVYQVTFLWHDANGIVQFTDVVAVSGGQAQSTEQPNSLGDWGVQALFQSPSGTTKEGVNYVTDTKATSFCVKATSVLVLPEYPVIGAAGAMVAMGLAFAVKLKIKKP